MVLCKLIAVQLDRPDTQSKKKIKAESQEEMSETRSILKKPRLGKGVKARFLWLCSSIVKISDFQPLTLRQIIHYSIGLQPFLVFMSLYVQLSRCGLLPLDVPIFKNPDAHVDK